MPDTTLDLAESAITQKTHVIKKIMVVLSIMVSIGGTLTGIMTYTNTGLTDTFFSDWLSAFGLTVLIVMPSGFLLMTMVARLINAVIPNATQTKHNIVVGIVMALAMESIMAATTAANNIGFSNPSTFLDAWFTGYIVALPFGLVIALAMSLTIKPKLEKFMAS